MSDRTTDTDPLGWFEPLYAEAAAGRAQIPWQRDEAHPLLAAWDPGTERGSAIVVGCGLGDDAEHLAGLGWRVTAFDISPTAVTTATSRHPGSPVGYRVADLLHLPQCWVGAFDLVVEVMTVQALPRALRARATRAVSSLVAPGGRLLVIGWYLPEGGDPSEGPPWLLTPEEVAAFAVGPVRLDQVVDAPYERGVRYRAELSRPA